MRFAHRRVRRRDFTELVGLYSASGLPAPVPDRATLRRFRHIVADLGVDFYVAVERERLVGMIHVVYTRHLSDGLHAEVIAWLVDPQRRRLGVGKGLLALATERARRRQCRTLAIAPGIAGELIGTSLEKRGWRSPGACFRIDLPSVSGQIEALRGE
jgi:GNAT superfamily N-acetyltransferase